MKWGYLATFLDEYSSINEEKIPSNWVDETMKEIDIEKSATKWGYDYKLWEDSNTGSLVGVSAIDLSINNKNANDVVDEVINHFKFSYDDIYQVYPNGNTWLIYYGSNYYYVRESKKDVLFYDYFCFSYNEKTNCIEMVNMQFSQFETNEEVVKFLAAYDEKLTIDCFEFEKNN